MPADGQMMPPDGQSPDQMMGGQQSPDQMMMGGQQDPQQMMEAMVNRGDFTLIGYSSDSAMTDFTDGTCYLQDGEMFPENTSEYLCIINTELASYNSIGVGDKITLVNPNNEDESYEFTIVGTYKNTSMDASTVNSASNDPANQIFTSYEIVNAIVEASYEIDEDAAIMSSSTGTYIFNSNQFEQIKLKILPKNIFICITSL